jgi:hypothetical protein
VVDAPRRVAEASEVIAVRALLIPKDLRKAPARILTRRLRVTARQLLNATSPTSWAGFSPQAH